MMEPVAVPMAERPMAVVVPVVPEPVEARAVEPVAARAVEPVAALQVAVRAAALQVAVRAVEPVAEHLKRLESVQPLMSLPVKSRFPVLAWN
jgi:hypothetical protein